MAKTITHIEALVIHRVLLRIEQIGMQNMREGRVDDALAMYRLIGTLIERCFPFAHFHKDNPLTDLRWREAS